MTETLKEAQSKIRTAFDGGVDIKCPCCGQRVARDKRSLNSEMAQTLMWMCFHTKFRPGEWMNIPKQAPKSVTKNREYSRLAHWGLIEAKPNEDPTKRTSGLWCLTTKGIDFANKRVTVPAYYFMFDRKIVGWAAAQVDIEGALGTSFDYQDVMRRQQLEPVYIPQGYENDNP